MIVPVAMPSVVRRASCHEARLWMKGIFWVRIMWMTSVCDQSDSTNQPVWKTASMGRKTEALSAFKEAQAAADSQTMILAEYIFLTQELQFCDKSDNNRKKIKDLNITGLKNRQIGYVPFGIFTIIFLTFSLFL